MHPDGVPAQHHSHKSMQVLQLAVGSTACHSTVQIIQPVPLAIHS
jgi:hypothetical protein